MRQQTFRFISILVVLVAFQNLTSRGAVHQGEVRQQAQGEGGSYCCDGRRGWAFISLCFSRVLVTFGIYGHDVRVRLHRGWNVSDFDFVSGSSFWQFNRRVRLDRFHQGLNHRTKNIPLLFRGCDATRNVCGFRARTRRLIRLFTHISIRNLLVFLFNLRDDVVVRLLVLQAEQRAALGVVDERALS